MGSIKFFSFYDLLHSSLEHISSKNNVITGGSGVGRGGICRDGKPNRVETLVFKV